MTLTQMHYLITIAETNSLNKAAEKLRFISKTTGLVLAPFDSLLVMRGIQTLSVRGPRACG